MQILHLCPSNVATGGTEGIHHLVSELCKCGADAKILYVGGDLFDPQPKEYESYGCSWVTQFPEDFTGVVIFPEIWANQIIEPKYKNCVVVVNWQGIDVYNWHTPVAERGKFLQREDAIHLTMSDYGVDYLHSLGLSANKVSDLIGAEFLQEFSEEYRRKDAVLYNPTAIKLTKFQQIVMARCTTELGIRFLPLENYTRSEIINLFRQSKLYIDFGQFSGRERLPREAVMCGCCILTSKNGTAGYDRDNAIPEIYKISDVDDAIHKIGYILRNYEQCVPDFDQYRRLLKQDRENYPAEVKRFYHKLQGRCK